MTKNIQQKFDEYQKHKMIFLDNLQPDDLRNGESFNQAEEIIDNINQALHVAILSKKDRREFINKALSNFFRENSPAQQKARDLADIYLKTKFNL